MRRILISLCVIILFIFLYSCTKTQEELIEEKFQNYVYENFDNPMDLREVISIQLNDSIDKNSIFEVLSLTYKLDSAAIKLLNNTNEYIYKLVTKKGYSREICNVDFSHYDRTRLREILLEITPLYMSCLSSRFYIADRTQLDSIYLTIDSLKIYEYEIKCRIFKEDEMKIEKYYATVNDTLIQINDNKLSLENFSETSEFWDLLEDYRESQRKHLNKVDNFKDIVDEYMTINQKYGIVTNLTEEWYK